MATKYLWLNPFCVYYLVKEGLIGYRKINKNSVGSKGEIMGLCTIYNCIINQNKCGKDCCGFLFSSWQFALFVNQRCTCF